MCQVNLISQELQSRQSDIRGNPKQAVHASSCLPHPQVSKVGYTEDGALAGLAVFAGDRQFPSSKQTGTHSWLLDPKFWLATLQDMADMELISRSHGESDST